MSYHYDRTGERIEDDDPRPHECDAGWVDSPGGGVSPCPQCRPEAYRRLLQRLRDRRSIAGTGLAGASGGWSA